jgi:hypothetical protein
VLKINFFYSDIEKGNYRPKVRNVNLENVTSKNSKYALWLRGFESSPITDVRLKDCTLNNNKNPNIISNVRNLVLENVKINGKLVSTAGLNFD